MRPIHAAAKAQANACGGLARRRAQPAPRGVADHAARTSSWAPTPREERTASCGRNGACATLNCCWRALATSFVRPSSLVASEAHRGAPQTWCCSATPALGNFVRTRAGIAAAAAAAHEVGPQAGPSRGRPARGAQPFSRRSTPAPLARTLIGRRSMFAEPEERLLAFNALDPSYRTYSECGHAYIGSSTLGAGRGPRRVGSSNQARASFGLWNFSGRRGKERDRREDGHCPTPSAVSIALGNRDSLCCCTAAQPQPSYPHSPWQRASNDAPSCPFFSQGLQGPQRSTPLLLACNFGAPAMMTVCSRCIAKPLAAGGQQRKQCSQCSTCALSTDPGMRCPAPSCPNHGFAAFAAFAACPPGATTSLFVGQPSGALCRASGRSRSAHIIRYQPTMIASTSTRVAPIAAAAAHRNACLCGLRYPRCFHIAELNSANLGTTGIQPANTPC